MEQSEEEFDLDMEAVLRGSSVLPTPYTVIAGEITACDGKNVFVSGDPATWKSDAIVVEKELPSFLTDLGLSGKLVDVAPQLLGKKFEFLVLPGTYQTNEDAACPLLSYVWPRLEKAQREREVVNARITWLNYNKLSRKLDSVVVFLLGKTVEIPFSEVGVRVTKTQVGTNLPVLVTHTEGGRLAVSHAQARHALRQAFAKQVPPSQYRAVREGQVQHLADYGALIEIAPGVSGLLPVRNLPGYHAAALNSFLQVGDLIKVTIDKVDAENNILLRPAQQLIFNDATQKQWKRAGELRDNTSAVEVILTEDVNVRHAGVHVRLPELPNLTGFIPVADLGRNKNLKKGDKVYACVTAAILKRSQLTLSAAEALRPEQVSEFIANLLPGYTFCSPVQKILNDGSVLVRISEQPRFDALLPVRFLEQDGAGYLSIGDLVRVKVYTVDEERQRVILTLQPKQASSE